ncbi:MAG: transglutaminaseTgpA domain-containing protein [Opitutales bacterium]
MAANSRARLNAEDLHQLRWLLGLGLTLLAYWTLLSLDTGSGLWLGAMVGVVLVCGLFPWLPGRLPGWFWRAAVPVVVVVVVGDFVWSRADVLPALVRSVALLTLYRCVQYRRRREDLQLLLLCLFMTVLSGVLTLSLMFAVQILLFAVLAMALLFVITLQQESARRMLTGADWEHFRWRVFLGRVRQGLDVRMCVLAGLLFLAMVATSTVIFVAMPRFSFEHSFSFAKLKGQSGFNEQISYGNVDYLEPDDSVAFRVDAPLGTVLESMPYWRMLVLDEYADNSFRASYLARRRFDKTTTFETPWFTGDGASPLRARVANDTLVPGNWKFYLEGDVSEYLPVLGPFAKLTFSAAQSFERNDSVEVYRIDETSTNVLGYEIGNMEFGAAIPASNEEISSLTKPHPARTRGGKRAPQYPETLLGLPKDPADLDYLQAAVAEIRGGRADLSEVEFVQRAIEFLHRDHANLNEVTVKSLPEGSKRDALVNWMNSRSGGWCEYFAGAFTLLARTAGYPTRVVAGYKGAALNTIEQYYVVRNSDAHAWAEIFDGHDQWLRVDPTLGAGSFVPGAAQASVLTPMKYERGWSARVDSLRMLWYRRVINFDQTDQAEFASTMGSYGKWFMGALHDRFVSYGNWMMKWLEAPLAQREREIWPLVLAAGLALLLRRRVQDWWLRRSAHGWLARFNHGPPVRRSAGRWLAQFEPAWQGWGSARPAPARALWEGARLDLLALRYGPLEQMPDPVEAFGRARALVREARRERSRWRSGKK